MATTLIPKEVLIRGIELRTIGAEELGNLLRDLVFLHDRLWILSSKEFQGLDHTRSWFFWRYRRPVPEDQKLALIAFKKESPWEFLLDIGSIGAAVGISRLFFDLLRQCLLLPGELEEQDLRIATLRHDLNEKIKTEESRILQASDRDLRLLPGLQGDFGERNYKALRGDIDRVARTPLKIGEVIVVKSIEHVSEKD